MHQVKGMYSMMDYSFAFIIHFEGFTFGIFVLALTNAFGVSALAVHINHGKIVVAKYFVVLAYYVNLSKLAACHSYPPQ